MNSVLLTAMLDLEAVKVRVHVLEAGKVQVRLRELLEVLLVLCPAMHLD